MHQNGYLFIFSSKINIYNMSNHHLDSVGLNGWIHIKDFKPDVTVGCDVASGCDVFTSVG